MTTDGYSGTLYNCKASSFHKCCLKQSDSSPYCILPVYFWISARKKSFWWCQSVCPGDCPPCLLQIFWTWRRTERNNHNDGINSPITGLRTDKWALKFDTVILGGLIDFLPSSQSVMVSPQFFNMVMEAFSMYGQADCHDCPEGGSHSLKEFCILSDHFCVPCRWMFSFVSQRSSRCTTCLSTMRLLP